MVAVAALAVMGCASVAAPGKRELMIVANDEKQAWDNDGKVVLNAGGRDTLSVYRHRRQSAGAPDHR